MQHCGATTATAPHRRHSHLLPGHSPCVRCAKQSPHPIAPASRGPRSPQSAARPRRRHPQPRLAHSAPLLRPSSTRNSHISSWRRPLACRAAGGGLTSASSSRPAWPGTRVPRLCPRPTRCPAVATAPGAQAAARTAAAAPLQQLLVSAASGALPARPARSPTACLLNPLPPPLPDAAVAGLLSGDRRQQQQAAAALRHSRRHASERAHRARAEAPWQAVRCGREQAASGAGPQDAAGPMQQRQCALAGRRPRAP